MSLSASLFGKDSFIFKATNIMGLGIPGLLDKWFGADEPKGQRLGDISAQTSKEAEPRVIVWGRVRPIGANTIHCQEPVKRWVKEKVEGGKGGGGKKTQKVEHVFRSYALGVCEGPITAFVRIWRNNKLVYDARGNDWGNRNNPIFLRSYRLYLGGWGQLPDPTLESIWGVGNVPGYRGTAYMVSIDEDLTETGGMVPQWQFEVERAEGTYLTSKPYSVDPVEGVELGTLSGKETPNTSYAEAAQLSELTIIDGSLKDLLVDYGYVEGMDLSALSVVDGSLRPLEPPAYTFPPEALQLSEVTITAGELKTVVRKYTIPTEAVDLSPLTIISGSLT